MMRESHTAILERHTREGGTWATEPYETAWAVELIYFVYLTEPLGLDACFRPQISADGQRWVDHGTAVALRAGSTGCAIPCRDFGGWNRLHVELPDDLGSAQVDIYLALKG